MISGIVLVISSIILWIYVTDILKPSRKHLGQKRNFESYIDDSEIENDADEGKDSRRNMYCPVYDSPGKQMLVLYGTEYGFSEEVARVLYDKLSEFTKNEVHGLQPRLLNAKYHKHLRLQDEQLVFIVIATSGDGVPPSSAMEWYNTLMSQTTNLTHLKFSVLALGDSNYPHFCRAGKTVYNRFLELGACPLVLRADVDMEDWAVINRWMDVVLKEVAILHPQLEERLDYLSPLLAGEGEEQGFHRLKPFMATLLLKEQITIHEETSDKETIHCEFSIEGSRLDYISGDAIGLYPTNQSSDVEWVLKVGGWHGDEDVEVPSSAYQPKQTDAVKLRECLCTYYDLKNIRVSLLEALCNHSEGAKKEELKNLLKDGTSRTNQRLWEYMETVEVGDVLEDFPSCLSPADFLSNLRPLQPRYYSISSSPVQDNNKVSVTAAVIRYSSRDRPRVGVATTFLQDRLQIGDLCPLFVSPNPDFRLPRDETKDVIMIGPGTGIAPFRAFIQERVALKARGKNLLYFGCRHKDKDFLYKDELERLVEEGHLVLRAAFSRDGDRKEYVQHLMQEDRGRLWEMMEAGAHLYVCGDARHMASDVHRTLLAIVESEGQRSNSQAKQYVQDLEETQRYQKDVWVT